MVKYTLFVLVTFLTVRSYADCAGNGIYFWPRGGIVNENPIFMIEGYANDESVVRSLNTDYPVYLKSGDDIVKLIVKEICIGQFYLTQAILVPESKLTAGKTYELVIENGPEYTTPLRTWNSGTSEYEPVIWKVIAGEDTTKPAWTQKPDEAKKTLVHYGCGPAINVHFNFAVYDESPVLLKTNVTAVKSGTSTTYYLDATDLTTVKIGHGMCSGAFMFNNGNEYTISFDLVDGSGNVNAWSYDAIRFSKPTDLNSAEN